VAVITAMSDRRTRSSERLVKEIKVKRSKRTNTNQNAILDLASSLASCRRRARTLIPCRWSRLDWMEEGVKFINVPSHISLAPHLVGFARPARCVGPSDMFQVRAMSSISVNVIYAKESHTTSVETPDVRQPLKAT